MEIDLPEKKEISEKEHRKFVDFMYPRFGLKNHPGYCRITIKLLPVGGVCFYDGTIYINDYSNIQHLTGTTWHESGHFLHWKKRGRLPENTGLKISGYSQDLALIYKECIADLGVLVYLNLTEGLDDESAKGYFYGGYDGSFNNLERALINIARTERPPNEKNQLELFPSEDVNATKVKGLLKRLVSNKDIRRSMRIIRSYQ